jgi:regulator of replication initiation timing
MKNVKTNLEKTMEDILDLSPEAASMKEVLTNGEILPAREMNSDNITDEDFEYARDNLKGIIDNGQQVIEELSSIASTSESPRAFEVLSALMKTIVDANKDLLELQSKVKRIKKDSIEIQPKNVTNALFLGSTKDLQNLLKNNST